jgi:TonB family protein
MGPIFRVISISLLLIVTVLFNIGLIDIRFEEIDFLLGKAAFDEEASNTFSIVAKYELIKQRMEFGEDYSENYELEARIQALISGDQFNKRDADGTRKQYLIPVRFVLNAIRFILGKEFINPTEENKAIKVLEIGYFWERTRKYPEAIKIYDQALGMPELSNDVRSAVLIHKAFSHSMMSEYDKAKITYERVINMYPNTEAGIVSWKLLDFIESIEKKREEVKNTDLSNFERAKQYYLVMDYRNAIKFYSIFLQGGEDDPFKGAEARYFKGRAHEELGESDEAVDEYRRAIRIDKTMQWAREANRRMLMLGEFYDYQKKVAQEAQRQLAAYQDGGFMNKVDRFRGMISESSVKNELMKQQGNGEQKKEKVNNDVMNLINSIGDLDLTGEKEQQKAMEKEIEKFRKDLIAAGIKSEEEIRELQRKQALTGNPFRRPSFLKETIDGNVNQLKYVYNRRLRQGVMLSGKMLVEMSIESDGGISSVKIVNSNMGDKVFEEEILAKIGTWKFNPVPDSLGVLRIRYPFEFFEED